MNENDLRHARTVALRLRIPKVTDPISRLAIELEDLFIKVERRGAALLRVDADWEAKHPRAGTPPNPGWFAHTGGEGESDARLQLPPGDRIDELGDLLEWIANAKSNDETAIRGEIKRLYYDVGDVRGGNALNYALSIVLIDQDEQTRQSVLEDFEPYTRSDPAEVAQFGRDLTTGALLSGLPGIISSDLPASAVAILVLSTEENVWALGWAARGRWIEEKLGANLPTWFKGIDDFRDGIATSIKSIDLNAATYQDAGRLSARINGYVKKLTEFNGAEYASLTVGSEQIETRVLNLAIPKGSITSVQKSVIDSAIENAKIVGVTLHITPF